jgi:hypothetical protein
MSNSLENWFTVKHYIEKNIEYIRKYYIPSTCELITFLLEDKYRDFSIFNTPDKDIEKHRNALSSYYIEERNLHRQLHLIDQQIGLHLF